MRRAFSSSCSIAAAVRRSGRLARRPTRGLPSVGQKALDAAAGRRMAHRTGGRGHCRARADDGSRDGRRRLHRCRALVVTTGTFLNGLVHVGEEQRPAGRADEPPSQRAGRVAQDPRLHVGPVEDRHSPAARSNEHRFRGRNSPRPIRGRARRRPAGAVLLLVAPRLSVLRSICHLLHTNARVRRLVQANIHRSPLFNGQIRGIGPRYCPSLEDKIVRFPHKERHQIFLEPEGLDVPEVYVNGFSTSLPRDVQVDRYTRSRAGRCRRAAAGIRRRIRLHPADRADAPPGNQARTGVVPGGPDKRDVRLRRGCGAGPGRRNQRGPLRARARRPRTSGATRPTSAFSSTT